MTGDWFIRQTPLGKSDLHGRYVDAKEIGNFFEFLYGVLTSHGIEDVVGTCTIEKNNDKK